MPKTLRDLSKMESIRNSGPDKPPPVPPKTRTSFTSRAVPIVRLPTQLREMIESQRNPRPKVKDSINERQQEASSSASPRTSGNIPQPFLPKTDTFAKWVHGVNGRSRNKTQLKDHVERAIREKRVFSILGTCEPIQNALFNRGWVEKPSAEISWQIFNTKPPEGKPDSKILNNYYEKAGFIHPILQNCTANLIWNASLRMINWREVEDNQLVNQSPGAKAAFCSKIGIADCVLDSHWFRNPDTVDLNFPRCYRLDSEEERVVFVNDYRLTACVALLQWLVTSYDQYGLGGVAAESGVGKTRWWAVDFALSHIQHYCRVRQNEDLDGELELPENYTNHWETFLQQFTKIVSNKQKLPSEIKPREAKEIVELSKKSLMEMQPYWTSMNVDGAHNIWICKPAYGCRGLGIILSSRLEEIFALQNPSKQRASSSTVGTYDGKNVVVQKYIEKPLLILKTKFDIRQWFFVSCWNPLSVWLYKDCYLRFCSAPFDLDHFHPKIHLCNTAVQRRYKVANKYREWSLPLDNVWELSTFKKHLKDLGREGIWDSDIYPRMKQSILSVVLPAQKILLDGSTKRVRQNSFELYGADFLISEDLTPWLIEVNSSPLMQDASSKITKLSRQCLEDCIKVIVDARINPEASTGRFELIHKQHIALDVFVQTKRGNIVVVGKSDKLFRRKVSRPPAAAQRFSNKKKNPKKSRNYEMENIVDAKANNNNTKLSALNLRSSLRRLIENSGKKKRSSSKGKENTLRSKSSSQFLIQNAGMWNGEENENLEEKMLGRSSTGNTTRSNSRSLSEASMQNNFSALELRL